MFRIIYGFTNYIGQAKAHNFHENLSIVTSHFEPAGHFYAHGLAWRTHFLFALESFNKITSNGRLNKDV